MMGPGPLAFTLLIGGTSVGSLEVRPATAKP